MKPTLQVINGNKTEPRQALRDFYERYGSSVRDRCRYLLKNSSEADDAMHEVFAKALKNFDQYRGEASPLTWLMQIATHHCLNVMRARQAGWHDEMKQIACIKPMENGGTSSLEGRDLVRAILEKFSYEIQTAAIHYYVDEMTLEEVALVIGRSVPTVRKRLAEFATAASTYAQQLAGQRSCTSIEESHG